MRILVIGAGAVGGYFGGRLVEAGRDVTFLVLAPRAEELKANGLEIVSPHGNAVLLPKVITAEQIQSAFDLILLGVKSYSLAGAIDDFAPAVGPETMIFPALNGMRHIGILSERFGKKSVLGGVCLVATELDEHGRIRQLADGQSLTYGELDGQRTRRIEEVDATLRNAGFEAKVSERIVADMWQKWVQLASLGAVNCLLRGNIGQIAAVPGGAEVSVSILQECAAIAAAAGYAPSEEVLAKHRAALTAKGSLMNTSMYRDLSKGLPVEADAIVGDLLLRGREHSVKTPLLEAAFANLSVYQNQL